MKFITLILLFLTSASQAQMLVTGKISYAKAEDVLLFNVPYENWYYEENNVTVQPGPNGEFSVELSITQPQVFFLRVGNKQVHLYGEPNKTLSIHFNALHPDSMAFSGNLQIENDFRKTTGLTWNTLFPERWKNKTTPAAEIFSFIQQNQQHALDKLDSLRGTISKAFISITRADIQYFAMSKLWSIFFNLHEGTHWPDKEEWTDALTRAYNARSLSDDNAQESYHYQNAVTYYPRFLQMKKGKAVAEEILHMPFDSLKAKGERYLEYNVLEYGLEGRSLERAKASFIIHGICQGKLSYLSEAYDDFRKQYPSGSYMNKVKEVMDPYLAMEEEKNQVEFITDNRNKTLEDILSSHRGRVVYIDLWGTWCGPCREEFKHNAALKATFKNEPVDFVYVAFEKSTAALKVWKETVSFYQLSGEHIFAGKDLEASFRNLYETSGNKSIILPSYLLVDKHGKLVNAHASRPSSGKTLYDEITAVLRKK